MPKDPFIREKFTRLRQAARKLAAEYFERYPKHRFQTEIESWRHLQSDNVEFTLKRLREPIDAENHGAVTRRIRHRVRSTVPLRAMG